MKTGTMRIARGVGIPVLRADTVIVGSGAAGLNCAEQLHAAGVRDILVLTSSLLGGTSYRSGSDKQTYYKLSVFGDAPDSPLDMARALFAGGCMDGETAYIEALYSPRAFFHLVENGVPFPSNAFGAFVGYKTDHDPRQRATSAGPKTSRYMVETSLARIRALGIPILDRMTVVRIVRAGPRKAAAGLVALDGRRTDGPGLGVTAVAAGRIVLAAGGPGELYAETVYPRGQIGLHGPALEAGADMVNLGESQFGIASTRFRWNLSGTYQQVIPSYFSLDEAGRRVDFLPDWYRSAAELAENIFLKGYQWPFNAARAADFGSSRVDMAVHAERAAGRRVFLDFLRSPSYEGATVDVEGLSGEAAAYLRRSGSLQRTPIERLAHMNPESIEIYREHGIDLRDPLEIAVCFQHNNGGIRVDTDWQTTVPGLFAVGEAAAAAAASLRSISVEIGSATVRARFDQRVLSR